MQDPFGGIKGKDIERMSGFAIDKEEALHELQHSFDLLDQKKVVKKTFLEKLRQKKSGIKNIDESAKHWSIMPDTDDEYAQINLRWCNKNIRSIYGIPIRSIRVALNGIKAFYNQINIRKPNINHPDVFEFYKLSKENYPDLPEIELGDENDLNDDFLDLDPFAGVRGIDIFKKFNDLKKDKDKTISEMNYSIEFLEQLELPKTRRDKKFANKKPKFITFTYKTSELYLNIHFWWVGSIIKTIENVELGRARLALASLKKFIVEIDVEFPNLDNEDINKIYFLTKEKHRPGQLKNSKPEIKPETEGGMSYWSMRSHRWVLPKFDKQTKKYLPPQKNL